MLQPKNYYQILVPYLLKISSNDGTFKCTYLNRILLFLVLIIFFTSPMFSQPSGFIVQEISTNWNQAVGITFDENGRRYVWEKGGKVYIDDGSANPDLFIDISEEVGNKSDHGLVGFALDPSFLTNGYIYLLYAVDRHHLHYFGTPNYDPFVNDNGGATIGRLTRYTAQSSTNFTTVDYNSRTILLGATIDDGIPIMSSTHGVGSVIFGTDGSLLVSMGDGASPSSNPLDEGSNSTSTWEQALSEGIIREDENVGAYRSQMLDSYNGKILRINPQNGEGYSSNPYYVPGNPDSIRSKVWALGLRNPYRMILKPNTGDHNINAGNPGVIYFGDVGSHIREELNVCTGPGQNFGWPIYEGITNQPGYDDPSFAPATWISPHKPPSVEWRNSTPRASVNGTIYNVGSPQVPGPFFIGNASTGGVWYTGDDFPEQYKNTYFHADYGGLWIHNFEFDANHQPTNVNFFEEELGAIVFVTTHPNEGGLYYINYLANAINKISYSPSGNQPPMAIAEADVHYGPADLVVHFDASASHDPEGSHLMYTWDFGDGSPFSNQAHTSHTFTAPAGVPTSYTVTLTVMDDESNIDVAQLNISVNNTPPSINSTSIDNINTYSINENTILELSANVTDAEHSSNELNYKWETSLYHDNHYHPDPPDFNASTTTLLSPVGCDGPVYWYRITLTVTDAAGLSSTFIKDIYPDCGGPVAVNDLATFPLINENISIDILANDTGEIDPSSVSIVKYPNLGTVQVNPTTGIVTYTRTLSGTSDNFSYTVSDFSQNISNYAQVSISEPGPPAVIILKPINNSVQAGNTIAVEYELSGNIAPGTHLHLTLDNNPHITIHNLSGTYTLNDVPNGNHTLIAQLANVHHNPLTNPEATHQVQFQNCAPTNLALNGTATQSSTYGDGVPGLAIDGNTNGSGGPWGSNASISHTQSEANAWWQVDLGEIIDIGNINIWNRTDCCGNRLNNYHVFVSDVPFTSTDPIATNNQMGVSDFLQSQTAGSPSNISIGRTGRYIRVQRIGVGILHMAEVQVFGCASNRIDQTISFDSIPDKLISDPPFILSATATSGLPVNFTILSGPATLGGTGGNEVTTTGAGMVTIRASQLGNLEYNAAPVIDQSFEVVNPAFQSISFDPIPDKLTTDAPFTVTASASSGLPVSFSVVSGPATINGNLVTLSGSEGTVVIRASQPGNASYDPAPNVDQSFLINAPSSCDIPSNLALNGSASQSSTYGDGVASIGIDGNTDGSGGPWGANATITHTQNQANSWWMVDLGDVAEIEYINIWNRTGSNASRLTNYYVFVSDVPFISTNPVTTTNQSGVSVFQQSQTAGSPTTIPVDRTGRYIRVQLVGSGFLHMAEVQVFGCTSDKIDQTITFNPILDKLISDPPFTISASATSGLPVSFNVLSGPATINGDLITLNGISGTVTIRASQLGNEQFNAAPVVDQSFEVVNPALQTISFDPIPDKLTTDAPFTVTASASSGLPVSFSVVSGPATINGNLVTLSGTEGTVVIRASQPGNASYDPAPNVDQSFDVNAPGSCITPTNLALNGAATQSSLYEEGYATIAIDGDTDGSRGPNGSNASVTHTQNEANAWWMVDLGDIAEIEAINIWNRTDCCANRLTNYYVFVSDVPFISTNPVTTTNQSGVSVFQQSQTAGSPTTIPIDRTGRFVRVQLVGSGIIHMAEVEVMGCTSNKIDQTITFDPIADKLTSDASFTVSASASSGLPVSFSVVSGPASISGDLVTLDGTEGTVVIRASQPGDASFDPAPDVDQSFDVTVPTLAQTITFDPIDDKLTTDAPFTVSASASSGLPVSFSVVSGPASISGDLVTLDGTEGTVVIRASQPGDASFDPAPDVDQFFVVINPTSPQTITFDPIDDKLTTDAPFTVSASASSGLPVSFSVVSGPASISGDLVTLDGTEGTVVIRASQPGDASFDPAPDVDQFFVVINPTSPQTIIFDPIDDKLTTDAPFTVSASASSGLPVSFSVVSGPASISGDLVTLDGTEGTVVIRASQPGDASFDPAPDVDQFFVVINPTSPQTITFDPIDDKLTTDAPFTVSASASSGLPVSFSVVSGPASISGDLVTLDGTEGTVVIRASQPGDASFDPAPDVDQFFVVINPTSPQTITFDPIDDKLTTDAPFTVSASASSGLPVSFSVVSGPASISGDLVTLDGTEGTVVIRASQPGDASFDPAPDVDQGFNVNTPLAQQLNISEPSARIGATIKDYALEINKENDRNIDIKIYPNPVYDEFTIEINTQMEDIVGITMFDLIGHEFQIGHYQVKTGISKVTVNVKNYKLAAGTYYLGLEFNKLKTHFYKVYVE